jgi:type IX secretion system PorP/SprF family membrane protein
MGAGLISKQLNYNRLTFDDMIQLPLGFYDPSGNPFPTAQSAPLRTKYIHPDFSAGLFVFGKKMYAGLAVKHLTQPNEYFYDAQQILQRNYTFHAGYEHIFLKKIKLIPNILASYQGQNLQMNVGVQTEIAPIAAGIYYRRALNASHALIFALGFQKNIFKIGYSYDLGISRFASLHYGAHEITLSVQLAESESGKRKRRMQKNIVCPSFIK